MEETFSKKIAVVTGGNKGIGLEICRQLCATGQILVVLTARDEQRGLYAVDGFQASTGSSSDVLFHQLDVADSASIASFSDFIRAKFGKLDILVNNAGISGSDLDDQAFVSIKQQGGGLSKLNTTALSQTYELAEKCILTNYYGTKKVTEALIPLLQLSQSPRIVNLTSFFGKLRFIPGMSIKEEISNIESLADDRLDELVESCLKDFKLGNLEENGWPTSRSAYTVSKVAISAYTRLLARRYPELCINCVHPGYIKTDMTWNLGTQPVEEGAKGPVKLALLPDGSPSGLFYDSTKVATFE